MVWARAMRSAWLWDLFTTCSLQWEMLSLWFLIQNQRAPLFFDGQGKHEKHCGEHLLWTWQFVSLDGLPVKKLCNDLQFTKGFPHFPAFPARRRGGSIWLKAAQLQFGWDTAWCKPLGKFFTTTPTTSAWYIFLFVFLCVDFVGCYGLLDGGRTRDALNNWICLLTKKSNSAKLTKTNPQTSFTKTTNQNCELRTISCCFAFLHLLSDCWVHQQPNWLAYMHTISFKHHVSSCYDATFTQPKATRLQVRRIVFLGNPQWYLHSNIVERC